MNIRIVTDSTCDLPEYVVSQHKIIIIPLHINQGDQTFFLHGPVIPQTDQIVVFVNLCADKPPSNIGMDFARCVVSDCALFYRPCANLIRADSKKANQAECLVAGVNEFACG